MNSADKRQHEEATSASSQTSYRQLYRSSTNRVLGGVCGGLGEYFNIDPTIIRVLFALLMFIGGTGLLLYIVLWIVIPEQGWQAGQSAAKHNALDMSQSARSVSQQIEPAATRRWLGVIILVVGIWFLLNNLGLGIGRMFGQLWPLIIIIIGFVILTRRS